MSRSAVSLLPLGLALMLGFTRPICGQTNSQAVNASGATSLNQPVATGGAASTAVTAGQAGTTTAPGTAANGTAPSGTAASVGAAVVDQLTDLKRFFTFTIDVREVYDDNIYAAQNGSPNKHSSLKEEITPSILFSYPMDNSTFDARYTFTGTHYDHRPGEAPWDQEHEVVLRYNHAFSDRFNLDLRDDGGYHTDPSLLDALGSTGVEGNYYSNIFTGEFTAQWTPLFGTVTSYSNNFISYENQTIGNEEDSDENTISQDFRFAFWPTVTLAVGAIYDNIDYTYSSRGFTNYTGNVGLDWQALPSLSLGFRLGGSITEINQGGGDSESPYASANINWQLGERSRLIGSYVHTVTPTDVFFAQGEESDRFTANFLYNISSKITVHLQGIYSVNDYTDDFLTEAGTNTSSFTENVIGIDTGVTYHYNQYLDFEAGYLLDFVQSDVNFEDYTRNQVYVGIRGTY
jgi:hypothetical protein